MRAVWLVTTIRYYHIVETSLKPFFFFSDANNTQVEAQIWNNFITIS